MRAQGLGDANAATVRAVKGQLEGTKQAGGPRDGLGDKPELSEYALPALVPDPFGSLQPLEDVGERLLPVRRQLYGLPYGVHDPAEDDLARPPTSVTFQQLLQRHGFQTLVGGDLRPGQHLVDGVQEVLAQGLHASRSTLSQLDEVIHEDVSVPERLGVGAVGRRSGLVGRPGDAGSRYYGKQVIGTLGFGFLGSWLHGW